MTPRPSLHIVTQWHGQAPPGQPDQRNTPPVFVEYVANKEGRTGMRVSYGLKGEKAQQLAAPIERGEWIDWSIRIKWSQKNDGHAEVWKNGELLSWKNGATRAIGPNMYNAEPHYFKIGIYRGYDLKFPTTVYYDDVTIARKQP